MTGAALAGQAVVALENARLHRIVERQALVDGLTGLANRRQADETLATELARAERLGGPVGLILADLDDFKAVNDLYGHPTGDIVLRDFAQTLRETVREIDTRRAGAARSSPSSCPAPTSRAPPSWPSGFAPRSPAARSSPPTASCSASPRASASRRRTAARRRRELVDAADDALYRAKRAGKNRVYAGAEAGDPPTRRNSRSAGRFLRGLRYNRAPARRPCPRPRRPYAG